MYTARITQSAYFTEDGIALPMRSWLPKSEVKAVILALHGFNDYSHFFAMPAQYFSEQGIACYAYDQRGFGQAPQRGYWAGSEAYVNDVAVLVNLLKQRYRELPVYLLGESMGGAIALTAVSQSLKSEVNGIILAAPAVWARSTMPWYQTGLLWTLAHTVPWMRLSGKGLGRQASDNIEMLRAMGRDPLIIKETRVEAIYGLTNLMDEAFASAKLLQENILLLYGEKDEIIPKEPVYQFVQQFLSEPGFFSKTVGIYPKSYHMLMRDLGAIAVWQDIVAWIGEHSEHLPSGAHEHAKKVLAEHS